MNDKMTITLELERRDNGTVGMQLNMNGQGFHFYEIIGLMQMECYRLAEKSIETAKELNKNNDLTT